MPQHDLDPLTQAAPPETAIGESAQRVMGDAASALTVLLAAPGDRHGLFRALAVEPATGAQLAQRTGLSPALPARVAGGHGRRWLRRLRRWHPRVQPPARPRPHARSQRHTGLGRRHPAVAARRLKDRVRFEHVAVGAPSPSDAGPDGMSSERFDLVLAFDVLHDAAEPAAVLAAARRALPAHGILLALELAGSDTLSDNLGP